MGNFIGVDYYPEHWPKERWPIDVKLMREMGVDMVRMAEFSWSYLEPVEGEFNFGWLDEAISLLAESGIKSILGTPSAAPPAWIIEAHPEIQPIDSEGRRRHFGGRHHCCQSNQNYRNHIKRYVTAFANHFKDNPNVIGWQIDNELGNSHQDLCLCPSCEERFRLWLKEKYGDIQTLNQKWGNAFWSQEYQGFSQIQAPKLTAAGYNPSALLDWKRFCSDLIVEFHKFQSTILRAAAPDKFITQNMMGFADKVNYYDLADDIDFSSDDKYPAGYFHPVQNISRAAENAAMLDFIRSTKNKSFWIMEQQSGITGWQILGRAPKPGQLGMWASQAIAHGADAIVFFRWRTCTMGTEQYWHGILPHSGIPGRYYYELKAFAQKVKPLMKEIQSAMPKANVAFLHSYDQLYAIDIQPHHPDMSYIGHLMVYFTAFYNRNIPVDFINEDMDFNKYDLIIAPLQYLMTPKLEEKYKGYVQAGGNLVLTMRAGVKDETNLCRTGNPLPGGGLNELVGLEVHEYDCLRDTTGWVLWDDVRYSCEKWSDIINLTGAKQLASYDFEFYSGTPAITLNSFGEGTVYYVGTEPSAELAAKLIDELMQQGDLCSLGETPLDVEITHRNIDGKDYIFIINHNGATKSVKIPEDWIAYYEGQSDEIKPFSVDVYTRKTKNLPDKDPS